MPAYNARIRVEQGASIMHVTSGASFTLDAGTQASFAGAASVTGTGLLGFGAGGSLNFNTTVSGTAFRFITGTSQPSIGAGENVPTHTAPMGSIYIRVNGSISGLYINITQDANGSTWRLHQQGSAIG